MEVETLKRLALLGAMKKDVNLSSSTFASLIGSSPQTASRRLLALEEEGYIERIVSNEGQQVRITEEGVLRLKADYRDYQRIFEDLHAERIRGRVAAGLGEGQYYISREGYRRQFSEKLGFDPSPGTLNLKLDEPFGLDESDPKSVRIEGFEDEGRTFGACRCRPVKIEGIKGAIVRPERTSYPASLLELIAPVNLRESLALSDGDEVEVVFE
jgi:riboflavin kinase